MPETRASQTIEPPNKTTMADNPPGLPHDAGVSDVIDTGATASEPPPTVPPVTTPVIGLTDNNTAMVKLFERPGAL